MIKFKHPESYSIEFFRLSSAIQFNKNEILIMGGMDETSQGV